MGVSAQRLHDYDNKSRGDGGQGGNPFRGAIRTVQTAKSSMLSFSRKRRQRTKNFRRQEKSGELPFGRVESRHVAGPAQRKSGATAQRNGHIRSSQEFEEDPRGGGTHVGVGELKVKPCGREQEGNIGDQLLGVSVGNLLTLTETMPRRGGSATGKSVRGGRGAATR